MALEEKPDELVQELAIRQILLISASLESYICLICHKDEDTGLIS